jgi:hypothetical protein
MLMEVIRYAVAAGIGLLLGRYFPIGQRAERSVRPEWHPREATIGGNPLRVIGGSRRGPGDGDSA